RTTMRGFLFGSLLAQVPATIRCLEVPGAGIEGWSIRFATISVPSGGPGSGRIAYRPIIGRRWRRRRHHIDLFWCDRAAYDCSDTETEQTGAYGVAMACASRSRYKGHAH